MGWVQASLWPAIKIAREWEPLGKGPDMDLERRVAYGLMHLDANCLSQDLVELTQLRATPTRDGWLVMVKGVRKKNRLIAFFHEATLRDAMRACTTSIDSSHTAWRIEEPAPWEL